MSGVRGRTLRSAWWTLAVVTIAGGHAAAFETPEADAEQAAVELLRGLYYGRDFHGAYARGQALVAELPDSVELRAWLLTAGASAGRNDESLASARALAEEHPENGWSWFALAAASHEDSELRQQALDASARALELLPGNADVLRVRVMVLSGADAREDAIALIDDHVDGIENPAELLAAKGRVLSGQAFGSGDRDPAKIEAALTAFEEARRVDPSNVDAHFYAGRLLAWMRRSDEAAPLLEEAARLSPAAPSIRTALWRAIVGSPSLSPEEKRRMVEEGIADLLGRAEGKPFSHPEALQTARHGYEQLGLDEEREALGEQLLSSYPDSPQAEWVLVERYRALREESGGDGQNREAKRRYVAMLREFIERPTHHRSSLKGDAYRSLYFVLAGDGEVDPAELLEVVWGMVEWEENNPHIAFADGAITLAEKTGFHRAAESIARLGMEAARKRIESQRRIYETEGDYDNAMKSYVGMMHDALGWTFFQEGRLEDAEAELLTAHEMNPKDRRNLLHLGQLAESRDDVKGAESYYIQALAIERRGENPASKALEDLYAAKHGGATGFDAYLSGIRERESAERKAEILGERIEDPKAAPAFELRDLDGTTRTLADLRGQIVIVNFWGIWCGWCVTEMPELQKLHETLADDPEVTLITINNDPNPDDVPAWMEEKGYGFPVLLDEGYVAGEAGISSFPTTWVLDKEGRIVFDKKGWSQELLEEFTWRIEAVREG